MARKIAEHETIALVTGAYGGMGRSCARQLGRRHRLALCDIDAARLANFADELRNEGYDVPVSQVCHIADPSAVASLVGAIKAEGRIGAIAHTAGLSPAIATWRPIVEVNLVGTALILDAVTDLMSVGSAAVVIASMAGYTAPREDEIDALIDRPLAKDLLSRLEEVVTRLSDGTERKTSTIAYGLSKRGVLRMCERRALDWASIGARIVSVSPGLISTPMGRQEASADANVQMLVDRTPVGRWGSALDIANAVDFLTSDMAGFITGCDLRVDGGITALVRGGAAL